MTALADTHALVWALSCPDQLSAKARTAFETHEIHASVVSLWELALKAGRPGCLVGDPEMWWIRHVSAPGIPAIPVRVPHILRSIHLPGIHRDPFDRMLIAQAIVEKMPVITKDEMLGKYGIPVIW